MKLDLWFCRMKRNVIIALLVVVAGLALGLAWWQGRPAYHRYKEKRVLEQMHRFIAERDYANALMSAGMALRLNPAQADACRLMAELAERANSPHALAWCRRLVELSPSFSNQIMLAACALRWEAPPYLLAQKALATISETNRTALHYHLVAARLAIQLNQSGQAEWHLREAMRQEPTNLVHQMNLAVLHLQTTNAPQMAEALATLERLGASRELGDQALRSLTTYHLSRAEWPAAQTSSIRLQTNAHATFDDRLIHLNLLHQIPGADLAGFLASVQAESATNAPKAGALSQWMSSHKLTGEALRWLQGLTHDVRIQPPIPVAIALCLAELKEWRQLELFLEERIWVGRDFERSAWLSLAAQKQEETEMSNRRWRKAVEAASDRPDQLWTLARMAQGWGWGQRREDLLLALAEKYPAERRSLEPICREYEAQGNTLGLHRIWSRLLPLDSTNTLVKNDLATVSLLLHTNLAQAHRLAQEVHQAHATNFVFASTYGYSLFLLGKTNEALLALQRLPVADLERPGIALYYGLLLAGNGETGRAAKYLSLAEKALLLPEEKALLRRAQGR